MATQFAAGRKVGVNNTQFVPTAETLARKILIVGTYDPAKTEVTPEVPVQIFSPEDAGDKFGFGYMIHRLALKADLGAQGIETWVMPQAEAGGAAASTGDIDFTGSTGVVAGTLSLYIAGESVPVALTTGISADDIATAVVTAVNADTTLPVTAAVDGVTTAQVNFTAKSKGPYGDEIDLSFNLATTDATPTGVTYVVTAMSSGSGIPTMADALDALGTGDDANEAFFTDMVHGYGQDSTTLDAISTYVGEGNTYTGLYAKTVARPFRAFTGDTAADTAGLSALTAIGAARTEDRSQGIFPVPGSPNAPSEIAAQVIGHMARVNNEYGSGSFEGVLLTGVWPGATADRWTSDSDNRETAVKAGISTSVVKNGNVYISDTVTFYHPASVPETSNGYREMTHISIIQNMLDSERTLLESDKWKGTVIVQDVTKVTGAAKRIARDVDAMIDDQVKLVQAWEANAWIADAAFTIDSLKATGAVVVNSGSNGFDVSKDVVLAGVGKAANSTINFDTSFAVLQ